MCKWTQVGKGNATSEGNQITFTYLQFKVMMMKTRSKGQNDKFLFETYGGKQYASCESFENPPTPPVDKQNVATSALAIEGNQLQKRAEKGGENQNT